MASLNLNINQIVESGNFELFKFLIDLDINLIDSVDDIYGRSPLIICSKYKKSETHLKIAQCLLDSGCDVNIQANYKWNTWTALMTSCYYGNARLVELLLNSNSNSELQDLQSNTACQIAIEQSNIDCVNLILNAMENKALNETKLDLERRLHDAVFNNDLASLRESLAKIKHYNLNLKQFINSTTSGSHTLLYRACRNSNPDIVKVLLESNAIAKPHFYTKYSPLYIACHMGNFQIAKLILEKFPHLIQIETIEKFLPFHAVCSQGHLEILKLLVNFDLASLRPSLLSLSYSQNYINKLENIYTDSENRPYLSLFDLNSLDVNDQSGLYHAVLTNRLEICEYLLSIRVKQLSQNQIEKQNLKKSKIELNLNNQAILFQQQLSPSIISSKSSNDSFLDQLKSVFLDSKSYDPFVINYTSNIEQYGPEIQVTQDLSNVLENDQNEYETENENEDENCFFNPIDINRYSKFGLTCLHEAIRNRNLKLVELLIHHGANSNLPVLDSNQNQISNSVVEALKSQNELIFYLVLKYFNYNEYDFKLILNFCFQLNDYGSKMLPYLLKFKIQNDPEHKISFYKRLNDFGLILNWCGLSLTKINETWLLNSTLNFKISIISNLASLNIKKFHLQSITRIDLSSNSLTQLPLCIFQIESLKYLKLSCNQLKQLPIEKNPSLDDISHKSKNINWACNSLEELELDFNEIAELPSQLFYLKSLKHLNVSHNRLERLPVEMWQAQCLFDLNASFNLISNLPLMPQSCCLPRSRKEQKRTTVKEHPLKSPVEEKRAFFNANKNDNSSELSYKVKAIDKANFWNKNSKILTTNFELNDQDLSDLEDEDKHAKIMSKTSKNSASNESKLIELNLSTNKFKKIPECLSCLCPKLVKLNMSSNQIESMGAVCDLPSSLKFLDLSNNLITQSIRLLNRTYFKFVLVYLNQFETMNKINESVDIKHRFENLLLENDFCYFSLIEKFLNSSKNSPVLSTQADLTVRSRQNREQSVQASLRSSSTRRRTRSQSRNPNRNSVSSLGLQNSINSPNSFDSPNNKRLIPFDLFLINLKYNRAYSTSSINDQFRIDDLTDQAEEDLELINKEKQVLNCQNIQLFLEQLCPHKRHIKLENLKSLNLSQNKLSKFTFMFDLTPVAQRTFDKDQSDSSELSSLEDDFKQDVNLSSGLHKSPLKKKPPLIPSHTQSPVKRNKTFLNKSEQKANMIAKLIFPNLTHLDLSSNLIVQLPGTLSYLENLSYLNASSNPLLARVSPKLGVLSKLWNFDLKSSSNLKDSTLDSLIRQKTKTSDILGYLKSILDNSRPYNRVKLMFVGVQAIGKTSLLNKLREEGNSSSLSWSNRSSNNQTSLSTVGIDINEWVYEKPKQKSNESQLMSNVYQLDGLNRTFGPIIFRTWDFAGQREYYTTHQYFISKRALYLVCWKLSEEEKGINEIHHWLSNIQTRAPGSPCIIVGTHQDQLAKLKNYKEISNYLQRLIYEKFVKPNAESETTSAAYPPIFASIEISSKTGHNVKALARLIYDVASQMKVPGMKDQLLLEQKIPCTYLALEECIHFVLKKLKTQSRNPVLNTQDYLKEIRYAIDFLYPEPDNNNNINNNNNSNSFDDLNFKGMSPSQKNMVKNGNKNSKILVRFRDDAEILQATQFLHENGILIHYNDVALNDLYFLDPQWLCDILATVVTIREINPFAAKGVMKIKDLLVLFKGSKRFSSESEEIMSYIVDLLGKFELALTWDNEHLLIPSLLPSEPMLKYSNQDIRISIISKQKLNSIINMNNLVQSVSCISSFQTQNQNEITSQLYSNVKLANSYSQMTLANKLNLEFLYECKTNSETDSLRRLYSLSYLPSGFFSRLIVRILCDSILKECLMDLIEIEQCDQLDHKLIEFLSQEAEWKCWQTGLELKYLDYTLIRVKEIIQDPLVDLEFNKEQNDLFSQNSVLFKDCENELKIKTNNKQFCSFVECYASFSNYKICKCKPANFETDNDDQDDSLIKINLNKQMSIKIFALIIEIIDSLLEDWYPDLGTRFMQDSKGDYLVTRLAPCDDCIKLPKALGPSYTSEIDDEEIEKLKQFEGTDWLYCFMLDDICYSVLKNSKLTCPKHGQKTASQIAPDLAFEDIEKKFLINPECLKIEKLLGRGSFGSVFFGSLQVNTSQQTTQIIKVAVKVLESLNNDNSIKDLDLVENKTASKKSNTSTFWNYRKSIRLAAKAYSIARQEIAIISSLKHENIVSMIGLCIKPLSIILELAPLGNLKDILMNYKKSACKLSPYVVQQVCTQVSSALVYLHSNRIIYRDLKADNVLVWKFPSPNQISSNLSVTIKLADYSISRCVLPTGTKGFAGTPGFMAPEILKYNGEETYSEKVDCFSFAMLLYELITLKHPFDGQEQIKDIILNGGRPVIKSQDLVYPTLMLDLMCLCWMDNPAERPSSSQLLKYSQSYEFSHLIDVTVLEDYEQAPLIVTCLNQENDEEFENENEDNLDLENYQNDGKKQSQEVYEVEDEEIEEEDLIDIWIVKNSNTSENSALSQIEILTYENKLNCTNRKSINVSNYKIESICILNKINQIWMIDSNKSIFIYCSKTYKKLNQCILDLNSNSEGQIIAMMALEALNQIILCTSSGLLVILYLNNCDFKFSTHDLTIRCNTILLLPSRFDNKSFDAWIGSENSEIFCFSLKSMKLTGSYLHSSSQHYLTNSSPKPNQSLAFSFSSDPSQSDFTNELNVTILKTTQIDTFFLWSYVYPGSTVYLWNHVSKKIMSAYNCRKAFDDMNFETKNIAQQRDFRIVDIEFLNSHLYCGINNGTVLVLKRLTLTPLLLFSSHMHQLHNLCSLTFETRLITLNRQSKQNAQSQVKKTHHMLLSLGRALAPTHEDIYLTNGKYRIDALRKYANCLILNAWNCNND